MRGRSNPQSSIGEKIDISLADEKEYKRQGTLDFIDNSLDRKSGTIHARATVPNADLMLTPGGFARVRMDYSAATPALLVPDASVLPDLSEHMVLVVGADNTVSSKVVQIGDVRGGLRVIRAGLEPSDKVIVEGIPKASPGAKVNPTLQSLKFAPDRG
ncbi:RND family efflux transporter MFP subunit [Pseudomonas sp. TE3786]